jgi:hypothetical protein
VTQSVISGGLFAVVQNNSDLMWWGASLGSVAQQPCDMKKPWPDAARRFGGFFYSLRLSASVSETCAIINRIF